MISSPLSLCAMFLQDGRDHGSSQLPVFSCFQQYLRIYDTFFVLYMFAIHLSSCFYLFLSNHSPPQLPVFLLFSAIFAHLRYLFLSFSYSILYAYTQNCPKDYQRSSTFLWLWSLSITFYKPALVLMNIVESFDYSKLFVYNFYSNKDIMPD